MSPRDPYPLGFRVTEGGQVVDLRDEMNTAPAPATGPEGDEREALRERLAEALHVEQYPFAADPLATVKAYLWREMDEGPVKDELRARADRLIDRAGLAASTSAPEGGSNLQSFVDLRNELARAAGHLDGINAVPLVTVDAIFAAALEGSVSAVRLEER